MDSDLFEFKDKDIYKSHRNFEAICSRNVTDNRHFANPDGISVVCTASFNREPVCINHTDYVVVKTRCQIDSLIWLRARAKLERESNVI